MEHEINIEIAKGMKIDKKKVGETNQRFHVVCLMHDADHNLDAFYCLYPFSVLLPVGTVHFVCPID
jgi:hypothetical protein